MSNPQNLDTAKQGLGDYIGQLARASQLHRLLERYIALAPVFIGGPSSTSLDLLPPPAPAKSSPSSAVTTGQCQWGQLGGPPPPLMPISPDQSGQNGLSHLQHLGMLSRIDFNSKLNNPLEPSAALPVQPNMTSENQSRNPLAFPQQGPGDYCQTLFDRMRAVQTVAVAAAAAQHQDHSHRRQHNSDGTFQRPVKRRRMSAGVGRGSGSLNHLSGEMIRKLREQQKLRAAAAAVAAAVANAAATSHSSGRPAVARRRDDSDKSSSSSSSLPTTTATAAVAPLPMRTQPPPLMSSRDCSSSEVLDTPLNGQLIPAFNIGGESRLCLPQILRQILGPFHWDQICLACEELQIHIAPCSTNQLIALKGKGVLPLAAHQCGLITKTDAERLISYLGLCYHKDSKDDQDFVKSGGDDQDDQETFGQHQLDVVHECFGKARATLFPDVYVNSASKCIRCKECRKFLNPQDFVRHLHTDRENRTCHWGFDPSHWRSYIHLDEAEYYNKSNEDESITERRTEDLSTSLQEAQELLNQIKARFVQSKLKRKQSESGGSSPAGSIGAKIPKLEETVSTKHEDILKNDNSATFDLSPTNRQTHVSPMRKFRPWSNEQQLQNGGGPFSSSHDTLEPTSAFTRVQIMSPRSQTLQYHQYSSPTHPVPTYRQGSKEVPVSHESIDDPSNYIEEVKQCLADEIGLSPKSRNLVIATITRLTDRVQLAENSRDLLARELVTLREKFQHLESELSKKCDELRQLFLMQQGSPKSDVTTNNNNNNNSSTSAEMPVSTLNGHASELPGHSQDLGAADVIRNISLKRLGLTSVTANTSINNNNNSNSNSESNSASPLNLSIDPEDIQADSSVDTYDSKESAECLKDRMLTIENEIRTLRQKLSTRTVSSDTADDKSPMEELTDENRVEYSLEERCGDEERSTEIRSTEIRSTSDLSEKDRRSLRRTRLRPRKFRHPEVDCDEESNEFAEDDDDDEENQNRTEFQEKS